MDWKTFSVMMFAVTTSLLILNLPVVQATEFTVYFFDTAYGPYQITEFAEVNVIGTGDTVTVYVENRTEYELLEVQIYRCGDKNPSECVSEETADSYVPENGLVEAEYGWEEVKGESDSGNVLVAVKTSTGGGPTWLTFWHTVTRGEFYEDVSTDTGSVEIHVDDFGNVNKIINFVQTRSMLPFNWIKEVVFPQLAETDTLYNLSSGGPPVFTPDAVIGNTIGDIFQKYMFIHPKDQAENIFNGVTLYSNPGYTCGNGECEDDERGESYSNCCFDCPCPEGRYCDVDRGCRSEGLINLAYKHPPLITIPNCFAPQTVHIVTRIENDPTGMTISGYRPLGGIGSYQMSCVPQAKENPGQTFTEVDCYLTVPVPAECTEDFEVTENGLEFSINYPDGNGQDTKTMTTYDVPDITVGTWSCGNGYCEGDLGETTSNCCFDCGCMSGQYCDYDGVNKDATRCKSTLSDMDIVVSRMDPEGFEGVGSGTVDFDMEIRNSPSSLSVYGYSCDADCTGVEDCTASCSVSCSEAGSESEDVYNSTCSLSFQIASYDVQESYTVSPNVSFTASYNNATQTIESILSKTIPIPVGSSFCGDGECGVGETSSSCCYDCGCETGYCEYETGTDFSSGVCRAGEISLTLDSVSETEFTSEIDIAGLTRQLKTNVTVSVRNAPVGMALFSYGCFFGENLDYYAVCVLPAGSCVRDGDKYVCEVIIPPINYQATDYYNPDTKKIEITPNTLNLTLRYNDGSEEVFRELSVGFDDLTITPEAYCGNSICDSEFGENVDNCCIDCTYCNETYSDGTVDWLCIPGGRIQESTCMREDEINLWVGRIESKCFIQPPYVGDECKFEWDADTTEMKISNAPESLAAGPFYHTLEDEEFEMTCNPDLTYEEGQFVAQNENYTCYITLPKITNTNPGNTTKNVGVRVQAGYSKEGTWTTQDLIYETELEIERIRSDEAKACKDDLEDIKDELHKADRWVSATKRFYITAGLTALVLFVVSIWCRYACALIGCILLGLSAGAYLYHLAIRGIYDELDSLKDSWEDACMGGGYFDQNAVDNQWDTALLGPITTALSVTSICISIVNQINFADTKNVPNPGGGDPSPPPTSGGGGGAGGPPASGAGAEAGGIDDPFGTGIKGVAAS